MSLFSSLSIPKPLADAIIARGYETATPVQVAVLEERCQGHDLLVSSQTGSGKTLAFGVLLAQVLLGETETEAQVPRGKGPRKPLGLVIAPTRELANQVRSELVWLFAKTHLQVASFTGGSDIVRDFSQLKRGVDLVVGTPGRLVDLLKREALGLDEVRVAVLDEADEMLDMGFREDLETLLGAATVRQHTHMFSATLPRPILGLAARYQKEAVRVDAHEEGAGGAHTDIEYVAHVVAYGDRLAAVINILRMHADQKAIVFGTTREGVASLHQALVRQGFNAVVLSGDRAQGERNRAIAAVKGNEAQVLVATNVAARGLDLPEVDLVVHADLPLNADSLTHRSGRTGRAGRKGRSVVIADPAERRKAERLLSIANASFVWSPAPTAEAIAEAERRRLENDLLSATLPKELDEVQGLAKRLLKDRKKEDLLELLLARELSRCPRGEALKPIDPKILARAPRLDATPRRKREDFDNDAIVFRVNLGAADKAEPGWLLPLICRRGGVTRNEVGAIRVSQNFSEFQIAGEAAQDFALAAARPDPRAPHVVIESTDSRHARSEKPRFFDKDHRDQKDQSFPRRFDKPNGKDHQAESLPRKFDTPHQHAKDRQPFPRKFDKPHNKDKSFTRKFDKPHDKNQSLPPKSDKSYHPDKGQSFAPKSDKPQRQDRQGVDSLEERKPFYFKFIRKPFQPSGGLAKVKRKHKD